MSDTDLTRPVTDDDIAEYEAAGPSLLGEKTRLLIRLNKLSLGLNASQLVVNVLLAVTILLMMSRDKIIPLFVAINGDTVETVRDVAELPPNKQDDVVKSVLWTTVRTCEEYYFHGAARNYDTCSAMLAGKAQEQYQTWFTRDPMGPQSRVGDRGHINVREVPNSADIKDNLDTCRNRDWCEATLSYWRSEQMYGQAPTTEKHYTASFAFVFVDSLPAGERSTFNPAGMKVISYHIDCDDCGS